MTKLLHFYVLFFVFNVFSQEKITLNGIVYSNNQPLNEVHIFNVATLRGTITNVKGTFKIEVSKGDKLVISAMPYREKQVIITGNLILSKELKINLVEDINTLNEITVKSRKLDGFLLLDTKKVPKDPNLKYKVSIDIKNYDLTQIPDTGYGEDRGRESNNVAPSGGNILGLVGLLVNVAFPPKYIREKPNTYTKETPSIIRKELGDDFFIKELKIPKVHIDDFLEEYCSSQTFIDLYEENKIIEYIEFLIEQNKLGKYSLKG